MHFPQQGVCTTQTKPRRMSLARHDLRFRCRSPCLIVMRDAKKDISDMALCMIRLSQTGGERLRG